MKKQVCSFSGGRTSAYLCKLLLEKFGKDNVEVVFMDTGAEHPETYSFIKKCNKHFNLDLKCLRAKFDDKLGVGTTYTLVDINDINCDFIHFNQMMRKYGVPYIGGMFCTDRLKTTPFKKYCHISNCSLFSLHSPSPILFHADVIFLFSRVLIL